jgi:alginate O-acetyltransferase complex protein AlgI
VLFNSPEFAVFFVVVTGVYYLIPQRIRWCWLLLCSCGFYMAFVPAYILILFLIITIDFFAGIAMEGSSGRQRRLILILSVLSNVGVLVFFKYLNFIQMNLEALAAFIGWNYSPHLLSIALPLGLSFHTFQAVGYLIEVYRGRFKAERHLGVFSLYVMFYPQLVAGPIERPQALLPQLRAHARFDSAQVVSGLKLMVWGLFKKAVIADNLAIAVDSVYQNPTGYEPLALWLAAICFAFQVFCDFSGYSDMAVGAARVMGIHLVANFDCPYHSTSVTEFWRRWHMSLSNWLRDYVFMPLMIHTRYWGWLGVLFSLNLTFLIMGLWHGANWTFVIFGLLHGLALTVEWHTRSFRKNCEKVFKPRIWSVLGITYTFLFWVTSLVFFRAPSVESARSFLHGMFFERHRLFEPLWNMDYLRAAVLSMGISKWQWIQIGMAILLLETIHLLQRRFSLGGWMRNWPASIRITLHYALAFIILYCGRFERSQFIYFDF